jgi:hypothetical protein
MSKDKKKKTKVLSINVISSCDGYWEWFDRSDIQTAPYDSTAALFSHPKPTPKTINHIVLEVLDTQPNAEGITVGQKLRPSV